MTAEKAGLMFLVFTLINMVCLTGVIICKNTTADLCIIGFQAIALMTQIGIIIADSKKSNKRR